MPYTELAAALYLSVQATFTSTEGALTTILFKAPVYLASMVLFLDAMARLGWL